MSPIANFPPNKETEVALKVAEIVLKQKDGHFENNSSGVTFGTKHGVAILTHGPDQSTLVCTEEIAKKLNETKKIKDTELIFRDPQLKK